MAELLSYDVLDAQDDPALDTLTRLAAEIAGTPIALVSLVAENRQWFKSRVGWEVRETPRGMSFCGHAVAARAPLVVDDAKRDPRFKDDPLVVGDPHVRAYAGFPLMDPAGHALGTLCVIDRKPRHFGAGELERLELLSQVILHTLQTAKTMAILRCVTNQVPSMLAYWDKNQRCQFANADYERWFGRKSETMIGISMEELLGPLYRLNLPFIEGALRGEPQHFERTIPDPGGGEPRRGEAHYIPHQSGGVVHGFSVMVSDVSAHVRLSKQLEEERQRSDSLRNQLEAVLNTMSEGLVVQTPDGAITVSNQAAESILGLSRDQLHGRTSRDPRWRSTREDGTPFPGEEHPALVTMRTGQPVRDVIMGVHKPSGELAWITINSRPMVAAGGITGAVTTFHDITLLRRAILRLAQQERLATLGTLAAGVGHEINNPLAFVVGNVELAIEELRAIAGPSPSGRLNELADVLAEAREGANRIGKIVRGLKALAREDLVLQPVELTGVIDTSISMAAHELKHKARVRQAVDPSVPAVLADESRLTQVLVNLLVNAAQAFETSDISRNEVVITAASKADGRVEIAVQDNGPGIPVDIQARIFDPFFTTKSVGTGTGLGLSVSSQIMATLGGELTVESRPGQTRFLVTLPLSQSPGAEKAVPQRPEGSASGRVMVVDDDLALAQTIKRVLSRDHEVVVLSDPREARKRLAADRDFHLILCDIMMPFLTGQEIFERVRERDRELADRFVFITGAVTDPSVRSFLDSLPNERLDKPFSIEALRQLARRYVQRGAPSREPEPR